MSKNNQTFEEYFTELHPSDIIRLYITETYPKHFEEEFLKASESIIDEAESQSQADYEYQQLHPPSYRKYDGLHQLY